MCYNICMSDDQFTRLFKYMEKRFDEVDKRFEETNERIDDVGGAVGELAAQVRDYHNESIFLKNHVNKLTEAIKQIAAETGIKLKVEL